MTVFVVEKWVVNPEKLEEHTQNMKKFRKFIKENPKLFKEVKSIKEFNQMFGGTTGTIIWLIEFESLADYERLNNRTEKDGEATKLTQEWMQLIDPASLSMEIWRAGEQ